MKIADFYQPKDAKLWYHNYPVFFSPVTVSIKGKDCLVIHWKKWNFEIEVTNEESEWINMEFMPDEIMDKLRMLVGQALDEFVNEHRDLLY